MSNNPELLTPTLIYNSFVNGDSLTNDQLDIGIEHFGALEELLLKSGPVFKLAANECMRVHDQLREYKKARLKKYQMDWICLDKN